MKTYTIEGVPCIEIHRDVIWQYLGDDGPICQLCPGYNAIAQKGCVMVDKSKGCPVDEILVPVDVTRSPEFIAALLEN